MFRILEQFICAEYIFRAYNLCAFPEDDPKKKKKEEEVNLHFRPYSFSSSLILSIRSVEKRSPLPNVNKTPD
jgi:hypothetical protein